MYWCVMEMKLLTNFLSFDYKSKRPCICKIKDTKQTLTQFKTKMVEASHVHGIAGDQQSQSTEAETVAPQIIDTGKPAGGFEAGQGFSMVEELDAKI